MTKQSHLFVLDPLGDLNLALDTSLRLARAIWQRGHAIYATEPKLLSWQNKGSSAVASVRELSFETGDLSSMGVGPKRTLELGDCTAIHMRKDPPFDLDYVATTWLLESAAACSRIYNAPSALRSINEKLALFLFPEESKPALVSSDPTLLLDFIEKNANGDAILKPLTLFGGRGVQRIQIDKEALAREEARETLIRETDHGTTCRIVQAFDQKIFQGEVRAFAVGGRALAWCLKMPRSQSYLANTAAGATLNPYEPTPLEKERVERVARRLLEMGVFFVGFDMIGGYLSEVNITSPRLLIGEGDTANYFEPMADWVIADCDAFVRK